MAETELNLVAALGDDRAEQQAEGGVADGGGMARQRDSPRREVLEIEEHLGGTAYLARGIKAP